MALKYLFTAAYNDGSEFRQTQEDRSLTREGGSAFTDVRVDDVIYFRLDSPEYSALVDLRDGHFEINRQRFWVGDDHQKIGNAKLRLIYFRRNRIDFTPDRVEIGRETVYYIGWQTTIDGKNYQQTIGLN